VAPPVFPLPSLPHPAARPSPWTPRAAVVLRDTPWNPLPGGRVAASLFVLSGGTLAGIDLDTGAIHAVALDASAEPPVPPARAAPRVRPPGVPAARPGRVARLPKPRADDDGPAGPGHRRGSRM